MYVRAWVLIFLLVDTKLRGEFYLFSVSRIALLKLLQRRQNSRTELSPRERVYGSTTLTQTTAIVELLLKLLLRKCYGKTERSKISLPNNKQIRFILYIKYTKVITIRDKSMYGDWKIDM